MDPNAWAGRRVETPLGSGRVSYVRMAPPLYIAVEAVSVILDAKAHLPTYGGTIFPVAHVTVKEHVA